MMTKKLVLAVCNSHAPPFSVASQKGRPPSDAGAPLPGGVDKEGDPETGRTLSDAEHRRVGQHETVPSTEPREEDGNCYGRSSEKIVAWGKGTHAGDNDTGRRAEEANSKPWGTKARRPYTKGWRAGGI
jgi:hypothetical protein